jgi:hypothetical protein
MENLRTELVGEDEREEGNIGVTAARRDERRRDLVTGECLESKKAPAGAGAFVDDDLFL